MNLRNGECAHGHSPNGLKSGVDGAKPDKIGKKMSKVMKKATIVKEAEKFNLDAYVGTKNIACCDFFGDCFGLTGFGISYADSVRYRHSAALREREPHTSLAFRFSLLNSSSTTLDAWWRALL